MVKDHIDIKIGNPLPSLHGYSKGLLYPLSLRQQNTYRSLWYTSPGAQGVTKKRKKKKSPMVDPLRRIDPATQISQASVLRTEVNSAPKYNRSSNQWALSGQQQLSLYQGESSG